MPRSKIKLDASRLPEEWPHSEALHGLDLDGVIEYLERTFVKNHPRPGSARRLLALIRKATRRVGMGYELTNRNLFKDMVGDLPDEPTFSEKLGDLLPVVWADHRIWWALAQKPPDSPVLKDALVAYSLLKFYNLQIPFRDSVWRELGTQPRKWNYFQVLMVMNAGCFFYLQAASLKDELTEAEHGFLKESLLGNLLRRYTCNPLQDWRPLLWRLQFPKPVLRRLHQAADKLAKDAAWCVKHPDRLEPHRAPPLHHRLRRLKEAKAIEDMVVRLQNDSTMSDNALAKQCMGRITAAGRRLAKEARRLAIYRDRLPIEFHKSFGDKNAPRTSA